MPGETARRSRRRPPPPRAVTGAAIIPEIGGGAIPPAARRRPARDRQGIVHAVTGSARRPPGLRQIVPGFHDHSLGGVAPDAQVSPAACGALAQKAAARPGAMNIVAGGAGDHPLAIAPPVAPEQRQPAMSPDRGAALPRAGGSSPRRRGRRPRRPRDRRRRSARSRCGPRWPRRAAPATRAPRDSRRTGPPAAAAPVAVPRRAGRAVRCGRDRGFARVTKQTGVGFAREHQPRGCGASPVGTVTGRAGEFPAGARRPAGLDERRVDARPPRLHRDRVRPEGRALGVERVLRRVAVEAQGLPGRHQLRRADPAARGNDGRRGR